MRQQKIDTQRLRIRKQFRFGIGNDGNSRRSCERTGRRLLMLERRQLEP